MNDELINFTIMRDTMYHYSFGVEQKFFAHNIESFYFHHYTNQQQKFDLPMAKPDAPEREKLRLS